jgi:uncharacterized small protein (DUF1192 family)
MFDRSDEDRPRKAATAHEIGQGLDALSLDDLDARIALLEREVARLREARTAREASRNAASAFFKR